MADYLYHGYDDHQLIYEPTYQVQLLYHNQQKGTSLLQGMPMIIFALEMPQQI